ncbi:MAG: cytochrome C-552 [Alphaproteobacteria bacterium]|nr:MAG: cytochrome C-552 [Alphaproteobacteria bacterium]
MRRTGVAALLAALCAAPATAAPPPAWKANCQVCHQADGQGLAGQFPRLAGRAATIATKPAGRAYLAAVVTNGLAGRITVDGTPIIGVMPSFATLSDRDLAAALSHAARGGTAAPFKPAEIAAARTTPMKNSAMTELRARLVADGTIP